MAATARPTTATTPSSGRERDKRVVIVLGASSGIGRACARAFAAQGARVVLAARGEERLTQAWRECDDEGATATLAQTADVLEQDQVQRVVDRAVAAFGGVDVLVHAANVMAYGTIEQVPPAVFERVVDTAILGTANVARSILPTFREQGRGALVIVTSLLASVPVPSMGAYITGKWGQLALARVLQLELRDEPDVHVCTLAPGSVDTPIFRQAANFAGHVGRPPPPVISAEKVPGPCCGWRTGRSSVGRWVRPTASSCSATDCCPRSTTASWVRSLASPRSPGTLCSRPRAMCSFPYGRKGRKTS